MTTIAVLDYGMGNLRSVCKAIEHVAPKAQVRLAHTPEEVRRADRVVFPGQGAIGGCVRALDEAGLRDALLESLKTKPFLGICLGLQALYAHSEEGGGTPGLGVLAGRVRRFNPPDETLKIPHMGWNQVRQARPHPLWRGIADNARFYFVHSYYAETADPGCVAGVTDYGQRFTSAAARENIFAVQFHPEKSQQAGLQLLTNFVAWEGHA
jgi:glutamine amidotransferase